MAGIQHAFVATVVIFMVVFFLYVCVVGYLWYKGL